ncbi:MAG: DMT family transporter [Solirubrobacteraceae bacterium]|nr:DMT family transporter [Solirubrobacteraceae bacterium]
MDRALAIAATIVVGGLIAFQPPVNSQLGRHVGVIGAAFVSTAISALVLLALYLVLNGGLGGLSALRDVPWHQLTGGLMGAALVTVSLVTVRTLGAGGVVAATVAGQLIVSALLDRAGVLGLEKVGLTPPRLAGMGLLIVGTLLITQPGR